MKQATKQAMSAKLKLALIGNGMASAKLLEELILSCNDRYEISVFGDDPHGNYNRIMLSPVLAGEKSQNDIGLLTPAWYEQNSVTPYSGTAGTVTAINRRNKTIQCADGNSHQYDRLVISTGSRPFMLPIPGIDLEGVMSFRDLYDVEKMISASQTGKHAVVVGAGLLGLEAAMGLKERGMDVTVINRATYPLNRQLDEEAGLCLQTQLEAKGLKFELDADTHAIHGTEHVTHVELADGKQLTADLVVMAIGIRPNIDLAKAAGIYCEQGIVVNDIMQSFDPSIYAIGECIQHRGDTFGLVAPLYDQAKVLANHLSEHGVAQYQTLPTATKLKVTGINVFSAGDFLGDESTEQLIYRDPGQGIYKKLVLRSERLIGAVMIGDTQDGAYYKDLIDSQDDVSSLRPYLMFGKALCEAQEPDKACEVAA